MTDPDATSPATPNPLPQKRVLVEFRAEDELATREQTGPGSARPERRLKDRADDIRDAIQEGTRIVAAGLRDLEVPTGWKVGEVSASFGITLGAEVGTTWIAKASAQATFNVEVKLIERTS